MTPETGLFLAKARRLLDEAEGMLSMQFNEAAGRSAYLAGFHAAQALISERTGRTVKTHGGVRTAFHRLVRGDTRISDKARSFLGATYRLKELADYETGPGSDVSPERAARAIDDAKEFIAMIVELLQDALPPRPSRPANDALASCRRRP